MLRKNGVRTDLKTRLQKQSTMTSLISTLRPPRRFCTSSVHPPHVRRRFSPAFSQTALLIATVGFCAAMVLKLMSLIWHNQIITDYGISLVSLGSSLFLVRALYPNNASFIFSTGFWLAVTIFFYFVLKSVEIWSKGLITPLIVEALWLCMLFLIVYCIVYVLTDARVRRIKAAPMLPAAEIVIRPGARWVMFAIFVAFKLLGIAMFAAAGGGNVLELSAATQNAGAAYLYRIPTVGNIVLLALMYDSFKNRRGWGATLIALTIFIVDAVLSTNRLSLVMAVIWSAFLYHRYRHPISLVKVALIGAPLVLVVTLFGYARNLEVGSVDAYLEAATVLINQPGLIIGLFMNRMDMLPALAIALDLHGEGVLGNMNGASYLYAFLHFVPRNLWESKPLLTAALATSEIYPGAFADGVNIFPSIILEGILNFSYFGIVLSGALVAVLCRQLERAVQADRLVPSVWALSLLTFPMALFNEGFHSNFTGTVIYMTALTVLLYTGLRIFGVLQRRRNRP